MSSATTTSPNTSTTTSTTSTTKKTLPPCCTPAVEQFSFVQVLVTVLKASISFIISLALNEAFKLTFGLIQVGGNPILGAWLYAIIIIGIGLLGLWGLSAVPPDA